jgi:non-specific serine/threonine protein kinase
MIGKTIFHYQIVKKLGEGGMGEVYLADDLKLERKVAIKFLPESLTKNRDNVERFEREAKAVAALNHPNIITIYDVLEADSRAESGRQLGIVMEYVDGKSLREVLNEYKLGIDKIADIIGQISAGLQQAHQAGIVHRDIKPENIFVGRDGRVRILDFGLVKLKGVSKLTKESSTLGTIHYMSPEQTRGETVDHRSDIWSLGVILYEMLSGQIPFKGDYDQAVMYAIINEKPQPLTEIASNVPDELERIVNRALAKDQQDRYQQVDDVLTEINKIGKELAHPDQSESKTGLKSIVIPGMILLIFIMLILGYLWLTADKKGTSEWENSIAVLPFDNISADPDQEYFCDGMTEQIITSLAKLNRLKVIGRTSVMKFKNTDKTLTEIGNELNVAHILEGSVRKYDDNIRVTAQLIKTEDGAHLWAEDYDRQLENIFAIQDDLSEKISRVLFQKLSDIDRTPVKSKKPANTEAYDYFIRATYFLSKYEHFLQIADLHKAEEMLKAAMDHDPNYAPIFAYLSDVYGTYVAEHPDQYEHPDKKEEYIRLQEKYIKIALSLDSNSADVLSKKAFLHWNKNEPEKRFKYLVKALSLEPNHFAANLQLGIFLRNYGLAHHSIKYFKKAIEINPLDPWDYAARGMAYTFIGEFENAAKDYQTALEIESNDYWTLYWYTELLLMLKRIQEAQEQLIKFEHTYPTKKSVKYCKSLLLAMQGDSINAKRLFDESGFKGVERVYLYSVLNDNTVAMNVLLDLQQEYKSRSLYLELRNMPWYDNLRSDPRFENILIQQKERYEENLHKYGDFDI